MKYRKFGKTDLNVSEIGFGAWAIGGNATVGETAIGWGPADDTTSKKAIEAAIDNGINFFDTADFYGLGHSEELIGSTVGRRKDIIIATKVGQRKHDDHIMLDYSKEYIISACEESLRRLQRNTIDLYQLHAARMKHLEEGACIEAMETLKQQGKIRYWGLSLNTFYPEPEAKFLMNDNLGDGFQLVFNLINQRAINIITEAGKKGYGIIARMPLQFGLLTGKFSAQTKFEKDDHRHFRLTPEIITNTLNILENKVWPSFKNTGENKTGLALGFILALREISTVITGIRTPQHVVQNTNGIQEVNAEQLAYLQSLANEDWKPVLELMEKQG
jgi:aryl-alcohol dehydrogenase-like predicted oxidoreductase